MPFPLQNIPHLMQFVYARLNPPSDFKVQRQWHFEQLEGDASNGGTYA
jgi:hypothetical protein